MPDIAKILHTALQVLLILLGFNLIIFVHELGHFLAGRWRGLKIDRFQIWFGKPIWKKTWNGVQYGLGWLPFGGFVSLPQMAPMESIEGRTSEKGEPLAPISPLDKIIVAIAGPLFSLLLALAAAGIVSVVGKPVDTIPTTKVGSVDKDSPGAKAGIRTGDTILAVNGQKVEVFAGSSKMNGIFEQIILSKGQEIHFTIQREGEPQPIELVSKFDIPETKWYQRKALREVGISPMPEMVLVSTVMKGSPAERAGLKQWDRLVSVNGRKVACVSDFLKFIAEAGTTPVEIAYERTSEGHDKMEDMKLSELKKLPWTPGTATVQAEVPVSPANHAPMVGLAPADIADQTSDTRTPGAWEQIGESLSMMWTTLDRVTSKDSSIGIDHLSGPAGIAKAQYRMLQMENPYNRLLGFFVLFNVNLAVLNMLPFPVLDGGHILLALMESIARRPVKARALEWVQTAFALMLISLMLYVTSKDLFGDIGGHRRDAPEVVFKQP
ncbi:RIP metalloprotease RseP [Luteolibacter sp. LG18]|uniref:RIP metalloprotease RseP n=1 Tax=Luteolibacter sp. LG18 TaxID=2819286 RepID=UPI002B3069DF|nr:putative zinc metalloprotease [Luteolibacter sp. LG18]